MRILEKWSNIEEKIWQQKSRASWVQLGDSNTKHFHAYVKERQSQNSIKLLVKNDGSRVQTQQQIKDDVRSFYMQIMGSAASELPMVDQNIVERGPVLSSQQQSGLCGPCSILEVKEALFSMDETKAPGMDGFNVCFFKKAWNIIGPSVVEAVQQFFETGFLPKVINCTYVTLLPKVENATSIKDYRPIACCSVLYKIISKILTNRFQQVIQYLVSDSQSAKVGLFFMISSLVMN